MSASPLDKAYAHSLRFLESLDHWPAGAPADLEALRAGFLRPSADDGCDPAQVVDELVAAAEPGLHGSAGGRFHGWVIGGALPASLAADWLTSAWDQNAGAYAVSPASSVVEEIAGAWVKELLGLPGEASFAFVTGCQMAHMTCLLAARNALLARQGWDVERDGLAGAPKVRILASDEHHATLGRAARFVGFGSACVVPLATGADCRVPPAELERALAGSHAPTILALQAGDLNTGAFDDFEALIPMAQAAGAWVHVDGAFGLWAKASPKLRHLASGVEEADSWATDGHKWLNVPYDCGLAFTAHPEAHRAAMTAEASYMQPAEAARDEWEWNPEFSRRARGFAVYAAIRELGRGGVARMVERCCEHCRALTRGIGALQGAELLHDPELNQGLVRFLDPSPDASEAEHDRKTDETIAAIVRTGEAFFGGVTWKGRRAMRISVSNWRTSQADVERTIAAVRSVLAG